MANDKMPTKRLPRHETVKGTRGEEFCPSVCLERSKGEEAWGEKVEGIIK